MFVTEVLVDRLLGDLGRCGDLIDATDCLPLPVRITRSLLGYGIIAGPIYVVVVAAQTATRDGFDPTRHAASQLANGQWGWIQIATFLITGAMTMAAAVGVRRALGPGLLSAWGSGLLGAYGAGLVIAGIFTAVLAHHRRGVRGQFHGAGVRIWRPGGDSGVHCGCGAGLGMAQHRVGQALWFGGTAVDAHVCGRDGERWTVAGRPG